MPTLLPIILFIQQEKKEEEEKPVLFVSKPKQKIPHLHLIFTYPAFATNKISATKDAAKGTGQVTARPPSRYD